MTLEEAEQGHAQRSGRGSSSVPCFTAWAAPVVGCHLVQPLYPLESPLPCWKHGVTHNWKKLQVLCKQLWVLYKQWTCWFGPSICKKNMWGFMEMSYSPKLLAPSQISSVQNTKFMYPFCPEREVCATYWWDSPFIRSRFANLQHQGNCFYPSVLLPKKWLFSQ